MREKRIWKKAVAMGAAAVLLTGILLGCAGEPAAAKSRENTGMVQKQSAVWTDLENYRGTLDIEASGLKTGEVFSACLSEYFLLDEEKEILPKGCLTEEEVITNQENRKTTVTKIIYEPQEQEIKEGKLHISIPVFLRREYAFPEQAAAYPVSREEQSPVLEVSAAGKELSILLEAVEEERKPGQNLWYRVKLTNAGDVTMENIRLRAELSQAGETLLWSPAPNLERNQESAVLKNLEKGETRTLAFSAETTEEMSGSLTCTVTAEVKADSGSSVIRNASAETELIPLEAAFEVEKTSDLDQASPGDTVTYRICIRNTGERTLHSVISTERFMHADIRAQFVEAEGIRLNSTRTQAMISMLSPGEAVVLQAEVVLPPDVKEQELINQVIVTTEETGEKSVRSQAEVQIQEKKDGVQSAEGGSGTGRSGTSAPKTGDRSGRELFEILMRVSVLVSAAAAARLIWHTR